ncbi:hypothetical protein [Nocardioides nanhaiensis]|uniref:Class I SAM-dependent methyltransferase n=1 Tax=Nocardioides nanhaiensis TaxID=1476871 RepID=A0ABP8VU15_9ACTN
MNDSRTLTERVIERAWQRRHPAWAQGKPGQEQPHVRLPATALPRYVATRASLQLRARWGAREPWITAEARSLLDQLLRPTDHGLEFGAGSTTPWFASRVASVRSVEGVERWHEALQEELRRQRVSNVELVLVSSAEMGYETDEHRAAYSGAFAALSPSSLDFVFVDGEYRDACALRGIELLRSGGLLILDNADTYLPGPTRSPWHVSAPATAGWREFFERTAQWRTIRTTNGVWDTQLWFKP